MEHVDDDEPGHPPPSWTLRRALTASIQAAHARSGMTIDELADRVGCDRKTVSRVVNGHRWHIDTLERVMRALGIEGDVAHAIQGDGP
ncbi:MAG: helix-turn-helix transcriptional regulator [Myxococcota bacterium]